MSISLSLCDTGTQYETTYQRFYPLYVSTAMLVSAIMWNYWTAITSIIEESTSS